jgi:o-succinylbenzoate---CoA ligase
MLDAVPPARGRPLATIDCDGSPAAVHAVYTALARVFADATPGVSTPGVSTSGTAMPANATPDAPAPAEECMGSDSGDPGDRVPAALPVAAEPSATRARVLAALRPDRPADGRTALVIATSGSTGQAKGVELPATALLASAAATHARLGGPGGWLLTLPVQHIAGAQVLVRSLLTGHKPAVLDLRGGFDVDAFAAAARAVPPVSAVPVPGPCRRYTALVPTQLVRLLDAGGAGLDALRGFDAVLVGGAACPPALLARARAGGVAVITTYGMTETAGGCVYDGRPLDGIRVRIGPGGRIELAGPTLALGYRLAPSATADAFRGGWFRTDDAGTLSTAGTLEVLGRLDDVIITGGRKVAPMLVERALATVSGVAEACAVGLPDPEWGELVAAAVVARDPAHPPTALALHTAARTHAGPHAVPKLIRVVPALPRRGPGKIDRAAVRDLLLHSICHSHGCDG